MILANGCNITKSENFKGVWILSVPTVYIFLTLKDPVAIDLHFMNDQGPWFQLEIFFHSSHIFFILDLFVYLFVIIVELLL